MPNKKHGNNHDARNKRQMAQKDLVDKRRKMEAAGYKMHAVAFRRKKGGKKNGAN